ncbi:MarR family transcriptional regulator [Methanoregula sp.]|uniref:MarR family transcriptional regulator n=1 Tax=Methanoregula sp. TaxID=2052170 RepID=UPI00356B3718
MQKVREILKTTDAMDLSGIVQESGLGVRAVRYALKRLKDQDLIVERFNWKDARKTLYQKAKV